MLIADQLRSIREQKLSRKETLRSARAFRAVTFRGLKTATQYRRLKHLRSSSAR